MRAQYTSLRQKSVATSHKQQVSMDAWRLSGMAKTLYGTQTLLCLNYNKIKRLPLARMNVSYMSWAKDLQKPRSINTNLVPDSC